MELQAYQNSDGGFGKGLEPDFKLPLSSPLATSIALSYLSLIGELTETQRIVHKAIAYLENTFIESRKGWFSVPAEVNKYPHAPWWEFKDDINMTVIDYSWGNPTAELLGYLYQCQQDIEKLDLKALLEYAITYLQGKDTFQSEHETYCFVRLYHALDKQYAVRLEQKIREAVDQLVCTNEAEWKQYKPIPLSFIEPQSTNYFGISDQLINKNLDYLIDQLESQVKIEPKWVWADYPQAWAKAKIEWSGILTLKALLLLKKSNRL